jgi:hypothetical protein
MKFKVGDVVRVRYAPTPCFSNWPIMVGHIGFIERPGGKGKRALVRTITIDGGYHSLAFIDTKALEPVNDPAWNKAVEVYRRNEGAQMSEKPKNLINPFELAKLASGVHAAIDVHDVQMIRPDISEARARGILLMHRRVIAQAMLVAGTQTLRALLENQNAN